MKVAQSCPTLCDPVDCSPPGSSVHGILQAKILEYWCVQSLSHVGLFVMVIDCSPPGYVVLGDSPGKNTRVGCHALLQGIFPTQGQNPGLPYCRWILYQLSYQGSQCTERALICQSFVERSRIWALLMTVHFSFFPCLNHINKMWSFSSSFGRVRT